MKLFKLFLFALALSFVAPQAMDAKPRKKARTTLVKKQSKKRAGHKHHMVMVDAAARSQLWKCSKCSYSYWDGAAGREIVSY